jgi:hypothetical protein
MRQKLFGTWGKFVKEVEEIFGVTLEQLEE